MPERRQPDHGLAVDWLAGPSIVNVRGRTDDEDFVAAVGGALGVAWPTRPCSTIEKDPLRVLWAGPDDWFVIGSAGQAAALQLRLREALAGLHAAVTDVSSGYAVLRLAGPAAREVLGQGCPLDLHPRAFGPGQCAGSHFFKASVWLWRIEGDAGFELLVRRSFVRYVALMIERGVPNRADESRAGAAAGPGAHS